MAVALTPPRRSPTANGIPYTEGLAKARSLRRRKSDATIVGEPTTEGLDVDHIPPLHEAKGSLPGGKPCSAALRNQDTAPA